MLSDLDPDVAGPRAVPGERRGEHVDEVGLGELTGRHVDEDAERKSVGVAGPPGGRLFGGGVEDALPEFDDQAVVLGDGDELVWPDPAPFGMVPASECLQG